MSVEAGTTFSGGLSIWVAELERRASGWQQTQLASHAVLLYPLPHVSNKVSQFVRTELG